MILIAVLYIRLYFERNTRHGPPRRGAGGALCVSPRAYYGYTSPDCSFEFAPKFAHPLSPPLYLPSSPFKLLFETKKI
jgi:hypothetical protein